MKNLFLLYACAEKFRAAKIGAINVSLSPKASMAEFHAAKIEDAMKFLEFFRKRVERGLEILKFLSARYFGSHKQAAGRRSEILKFAPGRVYYAHIAQNFSSQYGFKILKFIREPPRADEAEAGRAARLTSRYTYDAVEKRRAVKFNHAGGYLNSTWRRVVRLRSAATQHGYEVGRAEKLSKFDLTGALLNFTSRFTMQLCSAVTRRNYEAWRSEIYAVCLHKYSALIRAASGKISRYEVGRATNALLSQGVQRMKFYALNRHTMKFLKFLGARRLGLQAAVGRGFKILKFSAAERLKRRFEPQKQAAKPLNSSSLSPCRFKLALLKFTPAPSRNGFRNLKFTSVPRNRFEILKFTLAPHKFKPAPAVRLNFALNSIPPVSASKFENGIKFKGAAKFERGAR
ncbi:hypothetical protein [Campylobacter gracilis]|uniref:Uncharacterized protein n=1 Tax=Campylobacter gracilis RM3268 TaxID=553220 RepID=C8PGC9_9BACT|nr:hypothetical protein [Campylobacter gracilis]AKT92588.1 hypothetical protein CGRAC_1140 [Campylobacter gracilis]EEV18167.1 hypothetical protein CAMGR0001_0922 [Campylobacter gracilis RM3268]UEB45228.1 hypothetical protein LK410_09605 [Campylobacter gracilis]SUW82104.1 Uncharacterised protein [Campylobacter gracilis]